MRVLAIEASTMEASCALWLDGALVERRPDPALPSSETLLPAISALLAEAGLGFGQLDGIAYGAGPGAFTGLRVAIGIAQGLAFAHETPVVGVETLAAVAHAALRADPTATRALAALDARMNEIYAALYARDGDGVRRPGPIALGGAGDIALPDDPADCLLCGNAAAAYPDFAARCRALRPAAATLPRAADVAALGALALARGEGGPAESAAPLYVRDKVAQTVAERLARGGRA